MHHLSSFCVSQFIEPLDVLFLRANKLFGAAGSYGESQVPPWPSVAAGAYRSALLVARGLDISAYARGEIRDTELGDPQQPGAFTLAAWQLARLGSAGASSEAEPLYPLPADLVVFRATGPAGESESTQANYRLHPLQPRALPPGIVSSYPLPQVPLLATGQQAKPETGLWLTGAGMAAWLRGECPNPAQHLLAASRLWQMDPRIGIGLDPESRTSADGQLFTTQAVALQPGIGFVSQVRGVESMPSPLWLRLGGDGRGAQARTCTVAWPEPDYAAIARAGRCRLILTTHGLFQGWLPTGVQMDPDGRYRFALGGVSAALVSAAVPRSVVVSGWDMAKRPAQPKPAELAVPAGSVYWLDELQATPEALRQLVERGLWSTRAYAENTRRAEGYNRFILAQ